MRFLANENIPVNSITCLRAAGYDVKAIIEKRQGASDSDVLKLAYIERRVILTFDRDYGELIFKHKSTPPMGLIYFRFTPLTPEEPAELLLRLLLAKQINFLRKFTVIETEKIRQRPLKRSI